jgi:transcription elongation factor Elf1
MLSKAEEKKLQAIHKVISCSLPDCGQYIELRIDEHSNVLDEKKRIYSGSCSKCGKRFKFKHSYLTVLRKALVTPKIQVINTTFSELLSNDE